MIRKQVDEFLDTDKAAEGKTYSKAFRESLANFVTGISNEASRAARDVAPMKDTLPDADASVISKFRADVGDWVYYVIFKQVRGQVKGRLQLVFGWQFTVLYGKVEEIQIRSDHGVVFKVNGDFVLNDLVFKDRSLAVSRCDVLNEGIDALAYNPIEKCRLCGAKVDLSEDKHYLYSSIPTDGVLCNDCYMKLKSTDADSVDVDKVVEGIGDGIEEPKDGKDSVEDSDEGEADEKVKDIGSDSVDNERSSISDDSDRKDVGEGT